MKNNNFKFSLACFGLFLAMIGSTASVSAQTDPNPNRLCQWNKRVMACEVSAPDGYCAYGGPDCTTTVPTVEG